MGLLVDKKSLNSFIEWTSDKNSENSNFDVTFEFGSINSFSLVEIYFSPVYYDNWTNSNFFEIDILVSIDGKQFLEVSRSKNFTTQDEYVSIDMDNWIGKFAKVHFHLFNVSLIRVSEIYFNTTVLGLSSKQIEYIKSCVVNEKYYCSNACFFGLIGVIAVLTGTLLGIGIFWLYRKHNYHSVVGYYDY